MCIRIHLEKCGTASYRQGTYGMKVLEQVNVDWKMKGLLA